MSLLSQHSATQDRANGDNVGAAGFLAGKRFCFFTTFDNRTWIINSGASNHITPDLSLLDNVRVVHECCSIAMPNGKQAEIKHVSSMELQCNLVLKDVLHIPDFHFNLLSISKHKTILS